MPVVELSGSSFWVHLSNLVLLALLMISAYTDWRHRKIYNKVTIPSLLAGIFFAAMADFPAGLGSAVTACLLGFAVFYLMFLFGYMGGGDVKLVAAIGALTGYPFIIDALFCGIVLGGVYAIFILLIKGRFCENMKSILFFVWGLILWRQAHRLDSNGSVKIPYGLCISLGTMMAFVVKHAQ